MKLFLLFCTPTCNKKLIELYYVCRFEKVGNLVMHTTLSAVVMKNRKTADDNLQFHSWPNFGSSVEKFRLSKNIYTGQTHAEPQSNIAYFFACEMSHDHLVNTENLHIQILRNIGTELKFNVSIVYSMKDKDVSII